MRILTLSSLYPNEAQPGKGTFVESKVKRLKQYSDEIEQVVVSPVPAIPMLGGFMSGQKYIQKIKPEAIWDGVKVYYPRFTHVPGLSMYISPRMIYNACKPVIAKIIENGFDFDLIDAHYVYPDGVAAYYLSQYFKKPYTVTALGSDINILPNYNLPRSRICKTLENADGVAGVSKDLCDKMVQLGADKAKTTAIYNGVDLERFSPTDKAAAKKRVGLESNKTLLSIGNLVPLKGFDLIIKALEAIDGVNLIIVGDGPEEANLKALTQELNLEDRVTFAGRLPQDQLPDYYNAAEIYVLASSSEGMANVLLESIACGTPIIATPIDGIKEVVMNDTVGRVIENRTPSDIASAVNDLLNNKSDSEDIRQIAEQFNWDKTSEQQIELFSAAIQQT